MTATMVLTECMRCGAFGEQGERPGRCKLCAPKPDVLESLQRDVDQRHRKATRAAVEPSVEVPQRRKWEPRERERVDAQWWVVRGRRDTPAHLFAPGEPSPHTAGLCRTVVAGDQVRPAPRGMRGCRRCALAAGWITSLSEGVTT